MQTDLFVTHANENNPESQAHLEAIKTYFNKQCQQVFDLLMEGKELKVLEAHVTYKISSLPRRVLDLKQKGVAISDRWGMGVKVYFMSEANREANKKLIA